MKNKKGFTLIELLAVVTILGILMLASVPIVNKLVDNQRKKAFVLTAREIVSSGERYIMTRENKSEEIDLTSQNIPLDIENMEIESGTLGIDEDNSMALAIKNSRFCVIKEYNSDEYKITSDIKNCSIPLIPDLPKGDYKVGKVIYFNPVTKSICNDYVSENSKTGFKDGCMKWTVYKNDGRKIHMILDHNTSCSFPFSKEWSGDEKAKIVDRFRNVDTVNWHPTLRATDIVEPSKAVFFDPFDIVSGTKWYKEASKFQKMYWQREFPQDYSFPEPYMDASYFEIPSYFTDSGDKDICKVGYNGPSLPYYWGNSRIDYDDRQAWAIGLSHKAIYGVWVDYDMVGIRPVLVMNL